ncbi:MAG TPA: hypothetical protein VFP64_09865 [Pyrinomonadaceae bacterium]|nr:hypothetical protein [Pyrinomonadaceae bacterium]
MNTQLSIKMRRRRFSPIVVTLVVGFVAVLILGGPSVQAQTTTAAPATVDSSITIKTNGTVSDPSGAVKVSGDVIVKCRRVIDTSSTTIPPLVLLDFDFSQLTGTTGSGKTLTTYVTGGNHSAEIRPLQASDTIVVTVPYFDSTKDMLSASTFMATATLNFDISTGTLTSGTITYGTNVFKSTGVGTFTVN